MEDPDNQYLAAHDDETEAHDEAPSTDTAAEDNSEHELLLTRVATDRFGPAGHFVEVAADEVDDAVLATPTADQLALR